MKKLVCLILMLVTLCLLVTSASASAEENRQLSGLSEQECIAFLESAGVAIPDDGDDWGGFAKAVIAQVEEDPDHIFVFGYTYYQDFAEAIQTAVNEYYGVNSNVPHIVPRAAYVLQDSTVYGSWKEEYFD